MLKADLSEESGIRAVEARLQSDPTIALVINNAGTAKMGGLLTTDVREHQMIHVPEYHCSAVPRAMRALAAFSPRGQGTLINIASILALHALPGSAVYSASRRGC